MIVVGLACLVYLLRHLYFHVLLACFMDLLLLINVMTAAIIYMNNVIENTYELDAKVVGPQ